MIVVPFIELHHLAFQQDNPRLHVARICREFLEQEGIIDKVVLLFLKSYPIYSHNNNYNFFFMGLHSC